MTAEKLKLSIIATVRNECDSIENFVQSLLGQELKPDEIIIVDGESTDGTHEILERYHRNGKIILLSKECNIAEGRNHGISSARNELIAITDAGCNVDPDWLKEIAKCFAQTDNPDVVAGNFKFECHSSFERAIVLSTFSPNRENSERAIYYPSSRSLALKRSAWQKAGGYPEWLYAAEDTLFNIRLRQIGSKFVFCRNAIVRWRPRTSLKSFAKQRFNFARGNGRVGIATDGYIVNIKVHSIIAFFLLLSFFLPIMLVMVFGIFAIHVRKHLWHQAIQALHITKSTAIFLQVLFVLEFIRVVGIFGFLAGRWDRLVDPSFISNQVNWMGAESVDEVL